MMIIRYRLTLCLIILLLCFLACMVFYKLIDRREPPKYIQIPVTRSVTTKKLHSSLSDVKSPPKLPLSHYDNLTDQVTVVTAYFNIGSFPKGDSEIFTPSHYRKWIAIFSKIQNPVIAYFDSQESVDHFRVVRSAFPDSLTRIVLVSRKDLWAFQLEPRIKEIFAQEYYPQHKPNTLVAEYSCAMHAKYELTHRVASENPFRTHHIAWLDVGLFRGLLDLGGNPIEQSTAKFQITLPPNFTKNAIAYGQVYQLNEKLKSIRDIVGFNAVWVCGCFFIGQMEIMSNWAQEYMKAVVDMLNLNWMSTDQQVLYWMRTNGRVSTRLQIYKPTTENIFFHLGYKCRRVLHDNV